MERTLLIIALAGLLTGCQTYKTAHYPSLDDIKDCPGANGKDITIEYGDSKIDVTHKVSVGRDEKLVIKLEPDNQSDEGVDYKTLDIYLIGKDNASKWLNRALNAGDSNTKKAVICVDNRAADTYRYMVVVPGVGEIDPRIDVHD